MSRLANICKNLFTRDLCNLKPNNVRQITYFPPPDSYDDVDIPTDRQKLKFVDRTPTYPPTQKPPKMQKRLRYMRGPEPIHNYLLHKQYGIQAIGGGRLRSEHFESIRLTFTRRLDVRKMFAIWRVEAPWQPVTKKGQGQRMGGGKSAIDHYVTPIKAGRIIVEVAGKCEYKEVYNMLRIACANLPIRAIPVNEEIMQANKQREKYLEENNTNPFTMKYIIQNNMGGCHKWLSPVDHLWFGKYR